MAGIKFEEFEITTDKPIFYNPENGFYVTRTDKGVIKVESAIMKATGRIVAQGEWIVHPKFGQQFAAKRIFFPNKEAALANMLSSGYLHGVKAEKAKEITKLLGARLSEVLDACLENKDVEWRGATLPAKFVVKMAKGVGPIVLEGIIESWRAKRELFKYAIVATQAGLTMKEFKCAAGTIGHETLVKWIETSPYSLSIIPSFTWVLVDAIASLEWEGKVKIDHNDPTRLCAAIRETIKIYSNLGHMACPIKIAIEEAEKLATPTVPLWATVKDLLESEGIVGYEKDGLSYITTKELFDIELDTAKKIVALQSSESEFWNGIHTEVLSPEFDPQNFAPKGMTLSEKQSEAVIMSLSNMVSVLTGGPGTGKTAVTRVILNALDRYGITYTLCAPTGKAARRMQESTGRRAATLHKTFKLGFGAGEMLATQFLIIDEVSMVSSSMLQMVLEAVQIGKAVLFIGDADQLPPIGAGEPLLQMIESAAVPSTRLDQIFRQAANSGIIIAAHDVNHGKVPATSEGRDFIVRYTPNRNELSDIVMKAVAWISETHKMDIQDIAVLTPLNDDPHIGRKYLNKRFQEKYNPEGIVIVGTPFRIGDRVMQIKNDYAIGAEGIMNGQTGKVLSGKSERIPLVEVDLLDEEPDEDAFMTIDFDNEIVSVTEQQTAQIVLSYAMTIHKTQGSQFPAVVCAVPRSSHMEIRQIVYTALTRAEKICVLVVEDGALERSVKNEVKLRRQSVFGGMLDEILWETQKKEFLNEQQ